MKKSYIIVLSGLVIYLLLVVMFFWKDLFKENIQEYMYVGYNDKFILNNDKLKNYVGNNMPDDKYHIYENNAYKGEYNIKYHKNKIYLFDDNWNSIKLDGDFIAVSNNDIIKIKDFNIEQLSDVNDKYLRKVLNKYKVDINNIEELNVNQKITLDFDNDKENETLYLISNMFSQNIQSSKSFSFVYYVDDEKLQIINDDVVDNENALDSYNYLISTILDYNNDNKLEFIISKNKFSVPEDCKIIYKLEKKKYIMSNKCS